MVVEARARDMGGAIEVTCEEAEVPPFSREVRSFNAQAAPINRPEHLNKQARESSESNFT